MNIRNITLGERSQNKISTSYESIYTLCLNKCNESMLLEEWLLLESCQLERGRSEGLYSATMEMINILFLDLGTYFMGIFTF